MAQIKPKQVKRFRSVTSGVPEKQQISSPVWLASAARALKSVLQGILLSSEGEKLNSMNLVLYMAPIAVLFLVPATFLMEENMVGITIALARDDVKIIFYLLFNSALAYCVNFTNFLVTKHTSPLTLQVLGNVKGAVAVVISILMFKNPISATGVNISFYLFQSQGRKNNASPDLCEYSYIKM
ncbi:hypothetical protein HYC85_022102 [Camellia sinensis]|uniref:Sugar phosphate transporter domain-containing protein n=1 Tax=Camellia sinensis TaxID=4442 RepID=A0A7J7GL35_CAMSI|nr:hypothetical protein HYC85_022102 [Camellia sinensis]